MKIAVCALIYNEDGKILAVSRKTDYSDFGLPGGKVEEGESLKEALIREVAEETGLSLLNCRLIYANLSSSKSTYVYTYECTVTGKLHSPETIEQLGEGVIKWADWEDIEVGHSGDYNLHMHRVLDKLKEMNTDRFKVEDEVYVECYSSMGASSTGWERIKEVAHKFDENTGEKYQIVKAGGSWYDTRTGDAWHGPTMFYIDLEITNRGKS